MRQSQVLLFGPAGVVVLLMAVGIWIPGGMLSSGPRASVLQERSPVPSTVFLDVAGSSGRSTSGVTAPPMKEDLPMLAEVARDEAAPLVAGAAAGLVVPEPTSPQSGPEIGLPSTGGDVPLLAAASKVQEANVVAVLPGVLEAQPSAVEDVMVQEPALPVELFIVDAIRLKLNDVALSQAVHAGDLAALKTFYGEHDGAALWVMSTGLTPKAQSILDEIAKADQWGLESGAFALPSLGMDTSTVEARAAAEVAVGFAILKYAREARGGRADPSLVKKAFGRKPSLRAPGTVLTEIIASETPDTYLTDLHPKHEQFARLRQALLKTYAAGKAEPEDVRSLLINMERWRWMPKELGSGYLWLNIPEFMVHVVKDGKTVQSEKVVVGSSGSRTPVLSADLKSIVFNPERIVPHSIIRRDVLPSLQKGRWLRGADTSMLERYQLTVKRDGKPVDPSDIDWKKVDLATLTFVQAAGPSNTLGKVQFLYPNSRGVTMHDTILREQLDRSVRAMGEREPRVANPDELAAVLLAEDKGWAKGKVDKLIANGDSVAVKLGKPIPMHMTYFTAVAGEGGEVKTFADVYGRDGALASAISGGSGAPPVAQAVPVPQRKPTESATASRP